MIETDRRRRFLADLVVVYARHGLSLAHEDTGGAFLIRELNGEDVAWLLDARVTDAPGRRGDES